ncbi:MAG: hypothetical protein K9L30_06900 [Desulfobacterales bacterium]|nr:hypothetical protein [Desulfobacterales bacterium]
MAEKSIRFGINDDKGYRSSTWKCWSRSNVGKNDVYLACRSLGCAFKASLHQSGYWHVAYSNNFFEKKVESSEKIEKGRFIEKWFKPKEIAPGITLAYRIVTPSSSVNVPYDKSNFKRIHWISNANTGKATEISILISKPSTQISNWPGKNSMNTKLVATMILDNNEVVWIVYREIDMLKLPNLNTDPKYFKGKSKKDLICDNLRILIFGKEIDGSRVFYDCALEINNGDMSKG